MKLETNDVYYFIIISCFTQSFILIKKF